MSGDWGNYLSGVTWILRIYGPAILTALSLVLLVLDRKSDVQTKILWVLVIALVPVTGSLISLFVRPRLHKHL
ncbi:MAG: hypothetical protein RL166_587 [Actinomycetota bacterium]|jgi:hypothetical protein